MITQPPLAPTETRVEVIDLPREEDSIDFSRTFCGWREAVGVKSNSSGVKESSIVRLALTNDPDLARGYRLVKLEYEGINNNNNFVKFVVMAHEMALPSPADLDVSVPIELYYDENRNYRSKNPTTLIVRLGLLLAAFLPDGDYGQKIYLLHDSKYPINGGSFSYSL